MELVKFKENLKKIPKPIRLNVKFIKKSKIDVARITVKIHQGKIFGPQPFLAIRTRSNRYIHDNFDFSTKNIDHI